MVMYADHTVRRLIPLMAIFGMAFVHRRRVCPMMGISFTIPRGVRPLCIGSWDVEQLSVPQMVAPDGRLIHWGGAVQGKGVSRDGYSVFYSNVTGLFWMMVQKSIGLKYTSDTLMMYGTSG